MSLVRSLVRGMVSSTEVGCGSIDAISMLRLAQSRRVGFVMIGDSNQMYDGHGFDHGFGQYLHEKYGTYASPIYIPAISGTGQNLQGFSTSGYSGAINSSFTGLPSELEALSNPAGGFGPNGGYCYQASGDIGQFNGVVWSDDYLDPSRHLRGHLCYGTFPTGSGSFTPQWRMGESPWSVLVTGDAVSTTAAYSKEIVTLDLPAAARDFKLEIKWRLSTPSVGPNVQFWQCIEDVANHSGVQCNTLYGIGGQSLYDMAQWVTAQSSHSLENYFTAIRYLQEQAGQTPRVVMYLNSGLNDRNETSQPSLGPNPSTDPDSPEAYIDNLTAVVNKIESVWVNAGWPLDQMSWLIVPSHPISEPDDAELIAYRSASTSFALNNPRVSIFDISGQISSTEIDSNGWYDAAGNEHLEGSDAYHGIASLLGDLL